MSSSLDSDFAYRLLMQHPWAISLPALEAMVSGLRFGLAAGTKAGFFDDDDGAATEEKQVASGVGVIPIRGALKQHASFWDFFFGGASTENLSGLFQKYLNDSAIKAIVLDIDSPGGSTFGVSELANEILAARGKKPILAFANSLAASAAYHVGAAADRFYATQGALVGSVGVYWMHQDISKMADEAGLKVTFVKAGENKVRGNEFEELTDDDVAHFQAIVNETYGTMVNDIARGRGVSVADVKANYGKGDVVTSSQAKKAGMIDGIKTFAAVLEEAQTARPRALRNVANADAGDVELEAEDEIPIQQADVDGESRRARFQFKARNAAAGAA